MKELHPNIPNSDIYALVLAGFGQLKGTNPTYLNTLLSKYGFTLNETFGIAESYRKNEKGSSCNK